MSLHPNSLKNLDNRKKFVPGDSRIQKTGRPPGARNRKTLFAEWASHEAKCKDPSGNKVMLPILDKMVLAILTKASRGDISAANVVLDNIYGKINNTPEPEPPQPPFNWAAYTEDEIKLLTDLIAKGTYDNIVEFTNPGI